MQYINIQCNIEYACIWNGSSFNETCQTSDVSPVYESNSSEKKILDDFTENPDFSVYFFRNQVWNRLDFFK